MSNTMKMPKAVSSQVHLNIIGNKHSQTLGTYNACMYNTIPPKDVSSWQNICTTQKCVIFVVHLHKCKIIYVGTYNEQSEHILTDIQSCQKMGYLDRKCTAQRCVIFAVHVHLHKWIGTYNTHIQPAKRWVILTGNALPKDVSSLQYTYTNERL